MILRMTVTAAAAVLLAGAAAVALGQPGGKSGADPAQLVLRGAGATFPAPLYKKWIGVYAKSTPGIAIDYKDVGSGEGVKRFLERTVDFGASDAALTDEQISRVKPGATMVPVTAGMVVLAYNLPGLNGTLKLSRSAYLDILAGRILKWNDAAIQASNPGLNLPDRNIALVVRLDSSGTTFVLTNHLNTAGGKWREYGKGVGGVVSWPPHAMLGRGNEGVAGLIKVSIGSIGYVEYTFAKRLGLPMAQLENKAGRYVEPSAASGRAALAANLKSIPGNLRIFLPDPDGEESYPIVSLTWLLLYDRYPDPARGAALKRFVNWALTDGQSYGGELGYVGLPPDLVERSRAAVSTVQ